MLSQSAAHTAAEVDVRHTRQAATIAGLGFLLLQSAFLQSALGQDCRTHTRTAHLAGRVEDATGALVPGALVQIDGGLSVTSNDEGQFAACVGEGSHTLLISAAGFDPLIVHTLGHQLTATLKLKEVVQSVTVGEDSAGVDSQDVAGSRTLRKSDLRGMADDPDEFGRLLQVLAAASGGAPGEALVAVDGFQNGGKIPPKSAIAFIRVNPDLFSAEYERPPYRGGRIEIYTKPGQSQLHGALFTTQSAQWMNAQDPFAPTIAPIGRQRYGFELSGPLKANRSDFALSLEHRAINDFAVVNAITLDPAGHQVRTTANVTTPQSLWSASARLGLLASPKNNMALSFTADVDDLTNAGVGGVVLQESGYDSTQTEHNLRWSNLQTISANLIHESRVGYTWRYRDDKPHSTAAQVDVAGAFIAGGVSTQQLSSHGRDLEIDDDLMYSHGKHNVKLGVELLDISLHQHTPSGFNGTYMYDGGGAPALDGSGSTVFINGLEQYRRALLGLPGGSATAYSVTSGTPNVSLNQLRAALYGQDQWKLRQRLMLTFGLRWAMQDTPTTVGNAGPRLGLAWSPDRRQKWVLHAHTGMFYTPVDTSVPLAAIRLNGINQRQVQIYNPVYGSSPANSGTARIATMRAPLPNFTQSVSIQSHLGVEHDLPDHWHVQVNLYLVHAWDGERSRNINAPVDGLPGGPRPWATGTNIYQFQQTANLGGNVLFVGVDQHSLKRLQIFAGYIRMDLRGTSGSAFTFPQSNGSDRGELARLSFESTHHAICFATLQLPRKLSLTTQFDAASGTPYDVITGLDNNGDGVFNDRPFYASSRSSNVYYTRFGALSSTGTGATLGRNAGTLPWNIHLDENLSRSFALPDRKSHGQTLTLNLRSTNLLNHANVTAVGNVLGSPFFATPYAAAPGRRVEAGVRWSF